QATLATSDGGVTPTLNDVTIGFHEDPTISIGAAAVVEGDTGTTSASFTVALSTPSALPVSATWVTADGTAKAGSDYLQSGGTVTIAAGSLSASVRVKVIGEALVEPDET